ncbi:MAG: hypothetical protein NC039_09060, partial [Muribaculaceae bacterium]|nr:hypothetical protein [Muribaculaceae bacterium]
MTAAIAAMLAAALLLASCRSSPRTRSSHVDIRVMDAIHITWAYTSVPTDTTTLKNIAVYGSE